MVGMVELMCTTLDTTNYIQTEIVNEFKCSVGLYRFGVIFCVCGAHWTVWKGSVAKNGREKNVNSTEKEWTF